jgi:hypothetical protein
LLPQLGGNPNTVAGITIYNDTGSDYQTVYPEELLALHYNRFTYGGHAGRVRLRTANAVVDRDILLIEVKLLKDDGSPASDWLHEFGVLTPHIPGLPPLRLSGNGIRYQLYFATAPGNQQLYVAEKKHGIVSQLPVM